MPLMTELRRGLAPPGLLGCARRCRRYGVRNPRSNHDDESRLSCAVHSDSRPSAGCGSTAYCPCPWLWLCASVWVETAVHWQSSMPTWARPDSDCRGPPLAAWAACNTARGRARSPGHRDCTVWDVGLSRLSTERHGNAPEELRVGRAWELTETREEPVPEEPVPGTHGR